MRTRFSKWFRSSSPKSGGRESSSNSKISGSPKRAAKIQVRLSGGRKSPSRQVTIDRHEEKSIGDTSIQLIPSSPNVSHNRIDDHGPSNPSLPTAPTSQTAQYVDIATQTSSHAASLSWSPMDHPPKSFLVAPNPSSIYHQRNIFAQRPPFPGPSRASLPARHVVSRVGTETSLSPNYAAGVGSEESLRSGSPPSIASSSDSVVDEDSEVEEDTSEACGGIFLDPSSMMPPNIDRMLGFLVPGRQMSHLSPLISQNAEDAVAFLSADLDLGSLSEAWTRGLQTPVESSA